VAVAGAQVPVPFSIYGGGLLSFPNAPTEFKDAYKNGFHGMLGLGYKVAPIAQVVGKAEYHRFGFDLLFKLDKHFRSVKPVVGLLDFEITSPEIKPDKYELLKGMRERCTILGEDYLTYLGLGNPDLCDAFVARK